MAHSLISTGLWEVISSRHAGDAKTFGRLAIRSAYRAPAVNRFANRHGLSCASNLRNYGRHIWDRRDAVGAMGAMATVVVPWFADRYRDPLYVGLARGAGLPARDFFGIRRALVAHGSDQASPRLGDCRPAAVLSRFAPLARLGPNLGAAWAAICAA
jgi:hypothetical protein